MDDVNKGCLHDIAFNICDWDDVAHIPTAHFSLIINLLLPNHLISKRRSKIDLSDEINRRQMVHFNNAPPCKNMSVGSVAENYALPSIMSKAPGRMPFAIQYSDTDMLSVWDISSFRELDPDPENKQQLILETEETYPGYARVFINDPDTVLKNVDPSFSIMLNNKHYLSARKQTQDLLAKSMAEVSLLSKVFQVDSVGPAVGIEDPSMRTLKFLLKNFQGVQDRQELVSALPCKWPSIANKWKTRTRSNDWITPELVTSVAAEGCHVVPVAHRKSDHPDIEWRISFATSEVRLAKDVVTNHQRQCYIYLKLLRQIIMKDRKLLSSYHFKTVFLHACETISVSSWKENAGSCVLYLLDVLLNFVRKRCLPSYFIPENNLIGHFTEEEFQLAEAILLETRKDPIEPVLAFTDTHVIGNHSTMMTFRSLILPVLTDFTKFVDHRCNMTSMPAFIESSILMVNSLLIDNKIAETVSYMIDLFQFFQIYFPNQKASEYIYANIVNSKLIMQLVQILERCLEYVDQYPDILELREYLACLYHCASYNFELGSDKNRQIVQKATDLFLSLINSNGNEATTTIHYANLLLVEGKKEQSKELLQFLITSDRDSFTESNVKYNKILCIALDPSLRPHIQEIVNAHGIAVLPSLCVAHYLYVMCSIRMRGTEDSDVIKANADFQNYVSKYPNTWSYFLHGLTSMEIKEFGIAETSFQGAVSLQTPNTMALTKVHISHVLHLLESRGVVEVVQYLTKEAYLTVKGISKEQFLNYILLSLPKATLSVQVYQEVMEQYDETESRQHFGSNMACMRHASAYEYSIDSDEFITEITLADTLFYSSILTDRERSVPAKADYAVFLSMRGRWLEAKDMLENVLRDNKDSQSSNSYGTLEYNTLDENLKKEITIHDKFTVKSIALAYYFLLKCLFHLKSNDEDLQRVLSQFKTYVRQERDSRMHSLLGYIYIMLAKWEDAENSFCEAVVLSWDYAAAKQNISMCRPHLKPSYVQSRKLNKLYTPLCIIPDLAGDMTMDFDKVTSDF